MRWWLCGMLLFAPVPYGALASLHAPALIQAGKDVTRSDRPVTAAMEEKVRAFLDRFVDAGKTPSEQADLFADRVDYYEHGIVGRHEILRDVDRYIRHWPHRRYEVAEISYMSADTESDRVFVSYTIDFEVARGARRIHGKASYGAVITGLDSEPKVESIKEKVSARRYASNE